MERISLQQKLALTILANIVKKTGQNKPALNAELFKKIEELVPRTIYIDNFTASMHKLNEREYIEMVPVTKNGKLHRTKLAWAITKKGFDLIESKQSKNKQNITK